MVSGQQLVFKQASAKVRAEGIKPFTKAFGARMKTVLNQLKTKSGKKSRTTKRKSAGQRTKSRALPGKKKRSSSNSTKRSKGSNKMAAKKNGPLISPRVKKFLIGIGIGSAVSTGVALTRVREIENAGPVIDALAGGGVEGQLGIVIPRLIRQLSARFGANGNGFSFGNGGSGLAQEGA